MGTPKRTFRYLKKELTRGSFGTFFFKKKKEIDRAFLVRKTLDDIKYSIVLKLLIFNKLVKLVYQLFLSFFIIMTFNLGTNRPVTSVYLFDKIQLLNIK